MQEGIFQHVVSRRERCLRTANVFDALDGKHAHLVVLQARAPADTPALCMRKAIGMHEIRFAASARAPVIGECRLPVMQRGFERARNDAFPGSPAAASGTPAQRSGFDAR